MKLTIVPFVVVTTVGVACAPPQAVCTATSNCPDGEVCRAEQCVRPSPPTIARVDGDGSALAVNPRAGIEPPAGPAAPHRTRGEMIVTGTELDAVDSCSIAQGDITTTCEFRSLDDDAGGTVKRIAVPDVLVPGLMTLVLSGAAGEARADVFLLQGEPGAAGERGERGETGAPGIGKNAVVDVRPAGAACPGTGVIVVGGTDLDDDGVLDADEVGTDEQAVCVDTTGAIDCTSGVCTFSSPIDVPAITVAGHDVVKALPASTTISVPADEPTIEAAIRSLDGLAIPAGRFVTIALAAGTHAVPSPIRFDHPDGGRVFIVGASRTTTTIDAPNGFLEIASPLGVIDDVTIQGDGDSVGLSGVAGSFAFVGPDITIRNFDAGVQAIDDAFIQFFEGGATGRALLLENNVGALALHGTVLANGVEARDNTQFGMHAASGKLFAGGALVSGSPVGIRAGSAGVVLASEADASDNDVPFEAVAESYIEAFFANADGAAATCNALEASTIVLSGGTSTVSPVVDATSLVVR